MTHGVWHFCHCFTIWGQKINNWNDFSTCFYELKKSYINFSIQYDLLTCYWYDLRQTLLTTVFYFILG